MDANPWKHSLLLHFRAFPLDFNLRCNVSINLISACCSSLLHHRTEVFTISSNSTLARTFSPTLCTRSSVISTTTRNHSCGSLLFDVSLRERREETNWIVWKRKGRKITFSHYTWGGVQHCADPKGPLVPIFPQDHQKSNSTTPESCEKTFL